MTARSRVAGVAGCAVLTLIALVGAEGCSSDQQQPRADEQVASPAEVLKETVSAVIEADCSSARKNVYGSTAGIAQFLESCEHPRGPVAQYELDDSSFTATSKLPESAIPQGATDAVHVRYIYTDETGKKQSDTETVVDVAGSWKLLVDY